MRHPSEDLPRVRRQSARFQSVRMRVAILLVAIAALTVPAVASATVTSVLAGHTVSGSAVPCTTQSDGVRVCHGTDGGNTGPDLRLKSFDGVPLEVYVILPPAPGSDGNYPVIAQNHGYGQSAEGPGPASGASEYLGPTADTWARDGFAVLQLTARGFGDSCGKATSLTGMVACGTNGYIRLDDDRYEARDVQNALGLLVDAGLTDPARIGVTGESYGGGISLQLATLKDRVMYPDGTLHPWTSPGGTALHFAGAAPVIPWSDLVYSLLPNGRTLDYQVTGPTADLSPIGVAKQSFVAGLYALGQASGNYAPPGVNPEADLTTWFARINAGEPYDSDPTAQSIVTQIAQYHSAYYLLNGAYGAAKEAPSPLLIANGFTDDLFPVDEALRYTTLEHSLYPSDPVSMLDWDGGHMRGQNKAADNALLASRIKSFMELQLRGTGPAQPAFTALTQTCPATAPSGGPFQAASWAALHPGEVDFSSAPAKTIVSGAGDASIAKTFDPIAGGGACATAPAADQGTGVATLRLPAATGAGYTLLGSPTVIGTLTATGTYPEIAARLLDVNPATNTETLVARGLYRVDPALPNGLQVFQLHPGAWHFAAGHIPKLELLGQDAPYGRASNGTFTISISDLQLRLPVHEPPGTPGVGNPLAPVFSNPQPVGKSSGPAPGQPGGSCSARPRVRVGKHRAHAARHAISLTGTASEPVCAHASSATRRHQRVTRVLLTVSRTLRGGRCRFLLGNGRLTRARSCRRPVSFIARGTTRWRLGLHTRRAIPAGRYLVRADAIDGLRHHARRSGAAVVVVRVR